MPPERQSPPRTGQETSTQTPAPSLQLLPAEQLTVDQIDAFYRTYHGKHEGGWRNVGTAWQLLEHGVADPKSVIDYDGVGHLLRTDLKGYPRAPHVGSEKFLAAGTALASLPRFIARHEERRLPTIEEMHYEHQVFGRLLAYALVDRTYNLTANPVSRLLVHTLFARPESALLLSPASLRESMGPYSRDNHTAYTLDSATDKHPARIVYRSRNASGGGPAVLLRVGHKVMEAAHGGPLPIKGHDQDEMRRLTRHVARTLVDEAKGERIESDDRQLLDALYDRLVDKFLRRE